jgi:hypothetical protein
MTALPSKVEAALDDVMERVDQIAPGWLCGLYVTGSLALDDFHKPQSDVDFVGVTNRSLTNLEALALADAHDSIQSQYPFAIEGCYLEASALTRLPESHAAVPHVNAGGFVTGQCFLTNPVTWLSLATACIVVRGEQPNVLVDVAFTQQWCRDNLATYWRDLAASTRSRLAADGAASEAPADALAWLVLGAPRLHCTITTGSIISKTSAAGYASQMFDLDWIDVIAAARAARLGQIDSVTVAQLLVGCDFVDMVIDDAWQSV